MRKKATIKFNGGRLALLCDKCSVIIKTGISFTEEELKAARGEAKLPPQFCYNCKPQETKTAPFAIKKEDE
jgi:hypothetical protein